MTAGTHSYHNDLGVLALINSVTFRINSDVILHYSVIHGIASLSSLINKCLYVTWISTVGVVNVLSSCLVVL